MKRIDFKPGTMLNPVPAVLVSCGANEEEHNLITIAWTGTVSSDPAMCYISVRPSRHSYDIIKRNGEFVINLTTKNMAHATDWCGIRSGAKYDKWKECNLTKGEAKVVNVPIVMESPVNIECKVTEVIELGVHHLFLAKVVNVRVDEKHINKDTNAFDLAAANPLVYCHGGYFEMGKKIGKKGFSVEKKKRGSK